MKAEIEKQIHKLAEHMYETGYEDGRKENAKIADAGYSHGLNDAWDCAKKILQTSGDIKAHMKTIFEVYAWDNPLSIFEKYSASEAIEKIKEYEKNKRTEVTNGQMMEQMFLGITIKYIGFSAVVITTDDSGMEQEFSREWWDAPYNRKEN